MYIKTKELQKYIHEETISISSIGGNYYDKRGDVSQKAIYQILNKINIINEKESLKIRNKIFEYLNINDYDISEIYYTEDSIKSIANDYKTDILIILKNGDFKKISLKCSNKDNVGGLESNCGILCKVLNINDIDTYLSLKKFQEHGCAPTKFKIDNLQDYNIVNNIFYEYKTDIIDYVLRGYTDLNKGADYICFISMEYDVVFFGSIEEYKKEMDKLKIKTSFNSGMIITRASKTREIKFKIINIANIYGKTFKMIKNNYYPNDKQIIKHKKHIAGQLCFNFETVEIIEKI